jgi:hypothetical protein
MTLRVVGAGLGRTGTHSLKLALEQLLVGRCYHMIETFERPDDGPTWIRAQQDEPVDWHAFLAEYVATVDWPACDFWRPLSTAYPDAIVLLSVRESADAWWTSANATIFEALQLEAARGPEASWQAAFFATRAPILRDEDAAKAYYEEHNAAVRASVPPERLVEYTPGDGWAPLCDALDLPVPDAPFPHTNTTEEFRARLEGSLGE